MSEYPALRAAFTAEHLRTVDIECLGRHPRGSRFVHRCAFLSFSATMIAAGRRDNLAFAKTILSRSERDRLSSAVAFGLDRSGFQSQSERGVRRDVDEGVRTAHEGAVG